MKTWRARPAAVRYTVSVPYAEIAPAAPLRSLVACYWAISGPRQAHRVLPDGCIDIVVIDGEAIVVGAMTRAFVAPAGRSPSFGVRFKAGEAARILRDAPRELTDGRAPLDALWRDVASRLVDATPLARTPEDVLSLVKPMLDRVLVARLASHGEAVDLRVRAAAELLARGASVRAAAERACLSERQLSRRFAERVGVAPKLFARVMRLQRATSEIARGQSPLAASAIAGYADQAHFTRDARDLAGATPRVLVSELFKTETALAS
jgi:AraC-like DNA-binding protein